MKNIGIVNPSKENDIVLDESIVLYNLLENDKEKYEAFHESIGKFGVRDGILAEGCCEECGCPEDTAVIACAKEANSPEYQLYVRSCMAAKAAMEKMKQTFGNIANNRIQDRTNVLISNPRVQTAITAADNTCANATAKPNMLTVGGTVLQDGCCRK